MSHRPPPPTKPTDIRSLIPGSLWAKAWMCRRVVPCSLNLVIHCIGSSANGLSVGLAASPLSATNLTALQNLNTVEAGQKFSREYPRRMSLPKIASAAA